ncbi:hypothetical protein V6N13_134566 [Hibiscus sabdariffa]
MADALVSALVSTILNNLDSLFREEVGLAGSLKTELESLQRTFTTIQAVLHDAEQKQWKSEAINIWLRNLQQAAYDLEDVLEDFQSQARERGSKVSTFFSPQNPLLFRTSMARRVKAAREKVDAIAEERIKFHLETGVGEAVIERNKDRETSSLVDESEVIGRADEKGEMVSMILSNRDYLSVYAICGMGGLVTCKMHDLIHDVATSIKGYECRVIEPGERLKIPKTARHLFVHNSSSSRNVMDLSKLPPLRSLILDSKSHFSCNVSNPSNFFSNQKYLKVLDFGDEFSNAAFKSLKHLRYLGLHDFFVKALPESISSLHNLQTLNLERCFDLQMLPKGLKKLKNLKYLDLRGCDQLISMPVGLGQLTCLRKLSKFVVGVDKGRGIDELKELALEGELSITGLCNVKNSTEAKNANLIEKKNLRSLGLSWRSGKYSESCYHHEHGNAEEVLDALQPHPSLKKLCITDYQGVRFPNWMMDLLLPNLVEIKLLHCGRCDQLPPLGKLHFLKVLTIRGMGAVKRMDSSFYGDVESSFPSLEVLKIKGAGCLEEWTTMNGGEHFPLLRSLSIGGCPKFVKLPMLQSLKDLEVGNANDTLLKSLMMMNATNLTSLRLFQYGELPVGLLRNHKQLETLTIDGISLKSSSGLLDNLSSLKSLELRNCSELESLPRGLQNLRCLESLTLSGCEGLVSLAVNGLSSLSSLSIQSCGKLSSLPESIQHLSSLRRLSIWGCERLSGLPNEIQHLTSLSTLDIWCCPNMMSLPQGVRSLTALQTLTIGGCPHLERRCKKERGEDWPIIAHIPHIQITSTRSIRAFSFGANYARGH